MPTANRMGVCFVVFAMMGLASNMLPLHSSSPSPDAKFYTFAVSGWSKLRLIELGTDWPTKTKGPDDQLMFCRNVLRLAGFEVGARCAPEATTIADASTL